MNLQEWIESLPLEAPQRYYARRFLYMSDLEIKKFQKIQRSSFFTLSFRNKKAQRLQEKLKTKNQNQY